jgi:phosphinothricin acetyltransferase
VNGLEIRDATADDLAAILAIYNHEVRGGTATWDLEERTADEQGAWFEAHQSPYCAVVAVADGDVIGWGSLSRYHPRPGYRYTVEDTVYVRPDRQRLGIGRALLEALLERAKGAGFHTVLAKVSGDNAASIALHRACGFVEAGRERELGFKFGRWLDVVTLQLILQVE